MSIAEIIKEIPTLNAVERQALLLEIKKQEQIEASNLFAKVFEGVTEIEIFTPIISEIDMAHVMQFFKEEKIRLV